MVILDEPNLIEVVPGLADSRRLDNRHIRAGPALLPLDLIRRLKSGFWKTCFQSDHRPAVLSRVLSGGTSTSSIRWPRKVALARISVSRNDDADWSGMAASFSSRWSRQGEWTSCSGRAKIRRRSRLRQQSSWNSDRGKPGGRRPMT